MSEQLKDYEQFKKDVEFILSEAWIKHNWIFQPIYEMTRIAVLYYHEFYESKESDK